MPTITFRPVVLFMFALFAAGMVACDGKPGDDGGSKPTAASPSATNQDDRQVPPSSDAPSVALKVGDKIPDLTLKNTQNHDVNVSDLYAKQPIVLTVYRGGWCPYCVTNLKEWQDKLQQVTSLGAAVIAVSPESPEHVAETVGKGQLAYSVLSDSTGNAIKALGLAFTLDDTTQSKYKGYGIDLSKHNADGDWELPHPATYVVDSTGVIRYLYANEDYKQRANVDEVISAIRQLRDVPAK